MRRILLVLALQLGCAAGASLECNGSPAPETGTDSTELLELSEAKVDLNGAGLDELLEIPGISRSVAVAILRRRERLGCLRSLSDLMDVGGIGAPDVAQLRPYVFIGRGCAGRGGFRVEGLVGWRMGYLSSPDYGRRDPWTGDLRLLYGRGRAGLRTVSLRAKHRSGVTSLYGGLGFSVRGARVTLGEFRVRAAPELVLEVGRGSISVEGPYPAVKWKESRPSAAIATGAGERVRGFMLETGGRAEVVAVAGARITSWGRFGERLALVSAKLYESDGVTVRSGAAGWGRPLSGIAYASSAWSGRSSAISTAAAFRRKGGAWQFSWAVRRDRRRRLGLVAAGRWGDYDNPIGCRPMRAPGASKVAYRALLSGGVKRLVGLTLEELVETDGRGKIYRTQMLKVRRPLPHEMWLECELRADREEGSAAGVSGPRRLRVGLKAMRKTSGSAWSEFLFKADLRDSERSCLSGWRAGADKDFWELECGGFSYRTERSLYFYEKELAGLSSIKALKGNGLGWYLYLRLEPPRGPRPMSFMSAAELKLRVVLDGDSESPQAALGLQLVWR